MNLATGHATDIPDGEGQGQDGLKLRGIRGNFFSRRVES